MLSDVNLQTWVYVCLAVALAVLARHWRAGYGVGLMFTYVLSFTAMHWLAAAVYLLPWYTRGNLELTAAGLRESTIGLIALAIGAECAGAVLKARGIPLAKASGSQGPIDSRLVNTFLLTGLLTYVVIAPLASRLPSVGAVLSTGSSVIVAGVGLKCWNAWHARRPTLVWGWLALSVAFPLVTVVSQGFLGFGFAAMLILFAFVASFAGPRQLFAVIALVSWFAGLSVYVTYMRDRSDIRQVVWAGASLQERVNRLSQTFVEMEWFDPYDERHLQRIDLRLNQNFLIGAAAANLEPGFVKFAHGATIADAALAVIPRALWPDKPMKAGSGDLVSIYTGMRFPEGTSVGIGHVLECYVNFGTTGVAVGLFLIGALLTLVDRKAVDKLQRGDAHGFTRWYLPGLSLLLLGGSFIEMTSSAAAAFLMVIALNYISTHFLRPRATAPTLVFDLQPNTAAREVQR